jgi:hypothetical protein
MRYPDAVRFDGMIMWAASVTGPIAPPGSYAVRLTVGDQTQVRPIRLVRDPRSDATDADLRAQFTLLQQIGARTSDANNAVRTARNMRGQVADRTPRLSGAAAAEFTQLANTMLERVAAGEREIYQVQNQSMQDPLNYPIRLNNQIASLAGTVASGDYRPTAQAREAFTMLSGKLDVQLTVIRKALDDALPRLNAILKAAGLQPLVPSTEELKEKPKVAM